MVGSDGGHVSTVDKLSIKLTKNDPAAHGEHHIIDLDDVGSITDGKLVLSTTADEAQDEEHALEG